MASKITSQLKEQISAKMRIRLTYSTLVLSIVCFGAAFALAYLNRSGLTQFVWAGSCLAVWATVLGTSKREMPLPKYPLQYFKQPKK